MLGYVSVNWYMLVYCWFSWSPSIVMLVDQHTSNKKKTYSGLCWCELVYAGLVLV